MAKQDDYSRYTIRVPAALYKQLQDAAGDKSLNAEIIERLERSMRPGATIDEIATQTVKQIAAAPKHVPQQITDRFFATYDELKKQETGAMRRMLSARAEIIEQIGLIAPPIEDDPAFKGDEN